MNLNEIAAAAAAQIGAARAEVEKALKAGFDVMADEIVSGEEVRIFGFGTFRTKARAARNGRNPQTGAPLAIAAGKTVTFKPGKALKDRAA